ncbi:helix-turn-helix transcriptional regulator [Streptacidiphilus anmyonensis]|uniref:helix-turn-helix transcriptional regulator n=1 Tax=Streptacidiphilus anmyonensis TaxID=405782 RepID=UPI0005AABAC4|nr:LuxR C-terminal-related transcriptional regulator [Streptacidiphilus anmyonensis]
MTSPQLPAPLSPDAVAIYMQALAEGEFLPESAAEVTGLTDDGIALCRDELLAHCLLQRVSGADDRLVPVNPELAATRLAQPLEETIRNYRTAVDGTRERLLQLMPAYLGRTISGPATGGLEIITDPAEVQLLINQAANKCSRDLMTVQPGGKRDPGTLQRTLPLDLSIAQRGVRFRMLYQHTTRTQLSMRSYVSAMVESGAEIRTVDQLPERMFIFDREVAFIPKRSQANQPPGAVVVREPVLTSFLCALFEQFWIASTPFLVEGPGYQNVSDDLRRSLLELLAQGLKDEVVARRLGMSVRTCRRHISALMQELGAESRFEAGVRAAQLGLLKQRDDER